MGDLTNKQIDQTYDGLIKTSDEQPINGTLKNLQDGVGNDLPIQVSNTTVNFTGTVTGIPGGTDTTYDLEAVDAAPNATVRLTGSDATTDDVNLIAGTNVSLDVSQNNITINSTGGGGTDTTYDLDLVPDGPNATIELNGSDATTDVISIIPGNNVTFDLGTPGEFTINAAGAASAVNSLNLLDGDLTLVAGTGIGITDDGNTNITITATGGGGGGGLKAVSIPYTEVTGPSAVDAVGAAVLIPGGTFTTGDTMQLTGVMDYTNPGGWVYNSFWISDNPNSIGGYQIGAFQTPNNADQDAIPVYKVMTIRNVDNQTVCPDPDNMIFVAPGPYVNPGFVDWSVDQYLKWTYYIDNAATSFRVQGLTLTKISA